VLKTGTERGYYTPRSGIAGYQLYPRPKVVLQETNYVPLVHLVPGPWYSPSGSLYVSEPRMSEPHCQ